MGKKLIKIRGIIHLPGGPRFIVTLKPKGEEPFELMCTVLNGEKVNFRLPQRFVDFMGRRIDSAYFSNFDPDFSDELRYAEASDSIAANLAKCLLKLQNDILEIYNQEFTSGFYYEDTRLYHYMLSDRYELSEESEHKYGFLPVDETECIDSECLATVHKFLLEHPSCLPLFLYAITSLSESACDYSYTHEAKYSAWVCSPDYKNARTAANLLGNMFVYSPQSIYNAHKFHLNTNSKSGYDLYDYSDSFRDLPLLIFSNSASHKLSSKKSNYILDRTYSGRSKFYPIFVSPTSSYNYKALPLKIEDVRLQKNEFRNLKENINLIYRKFIDSICNGGLLQNNHFLTKGILFSDLRKIIQSPLAFPLLNPRFVVLDRQEQDVPRGLIDFNIEINDIWNDIIRYIPEELDLMLNIFSRFQDLNDKAQNKSKDCYVIYMPMLTSDTKMLIDVCNIVLLDVEDVLTPEFVIYRKKVISSLNQLRKAICRCIYINKLRYALEYYNAFLVRLGFERVYRKNFIADAHKILDVYFDKGHLPNVTPDAVQTPIDKDVEKFCKKLTKIIDWHLDKHQSNLIRKTTVRISHSKKCDAYEIDSTLLKKWLRIVLTFHSENF